MATNPFVLISAGILTLFSAATCKSGEKNIVDPGPQPQSLLWKIEGNGIEKPSYLFGTIHLINEADFRIREELMQAIDASETIVLEVNVKEINSLEVMGKTMIGEGKSLEDIMKPKDYEMVINYMTDSLGMEELELMIITRMKPAFITQFLLKGELSESSKSYEMELADLAGEKEKELAGIETIGEQLSIIDSIPLDEQVEM